MDGLWDELCEVVTGFRTALGGAQEYFGIVPDMVTFAKCISNGFALGAVVGKPEIMKVALDSFISSVYWAEATGLAACKAQIKEHRTRQVSAIIREIGGSFIQGLGTPKRRSTRCRKCRDRFETEEKLTQTLEGFEENVFGVTVGAAIKGNSQQRGDSSARFEVHCIIPRSALTADVEERGQGIQTDLSPSEDKAPPVLTRSAA